MTLNLSTWPQPESRLSRLDPRWRLAGLMLCVIAVSVLVTPAAAGAALAGALALAAVARLPFNWVMLRIGGLAIALLPLVILLPITTGGESIASLGPVRFSERGAWLALVIVLKGLAIGTLTLVLLATARFADTLAAAHALGVPGRLVHLTLLTHRYVFVLADEVKRLRLALRVRGFRTRFNRHSYRTAGHVTGTLFVHGAERAERVAAAMRCRGFDGQFRELRDYRSTATDLAAFALLTLAALALVVLDRLR